jgi:hypothetical protein
MVGIALAIVLNYQANISAQEESREEMPDIEVLTPEGIVMQSGETKVIPLEVRITSKEPITAQIAVYSISPEEAEQGTAMTDSNDLVEQFEELRQKGFTDGFEGSLDTERLIAAGTPDGDATIEKINLTLTSPADIAAGDYYFAYSVFGDTTTWDSISSGAFMVAIE